MQASGFLRVCYYLIKYELEFKTPRDKWCLHIKHAHLFQYHFHITTRLWIINESRTLTKKLINIYRREY